jgi:hypothetical protein
MFKTLRSIRVVILAALMLQTAMGAEALPPATQWIPQDAVIALELSSPEPLLELLAGPPMSEAVTALPLYQQQTSNPQFAEFLAVIKFLETALDTDWRTGLRKLTAGGVTLAVCPEDTVVLIADAEDEYLLSRLHEILLTFARSEAEKEGQPDLVAPKQYGDVKVWTFNGQEAHAVIGKRFVLCNRPEGLKAVLERRAGNGEATLASSSRFQAAQRAAGSDAIATLSVNLKPLMNLPGLAQVFDGARENPLAALAFAGLVEAIRDADWLAAGLSVEQSTLTLRASVDGAAVDPASSVGFTWPKESGEGVFPNLSVPRRIAALSLYRDLHQFYSAKDDLFPERTSGLIFFENMMGIFFSGRDLTNEVLAEIKPEIRFVVAEQEFDPALGTPRIQFPAVAMVLRLRNAEQFNEVVEEAWQKLVGLVNFTRGQQALQGLIIDRLFQGETKFTVAYFSTTGIEDKTTLDQRFNLRPALAMPGEYVILSSTGDLARDLIDALNQESERTAPPLAETHSLVEIEGRQLAAVLGANRETLIRGDMVEKGNTREQSEGGINMLLTLVELVDNVKLNIGAHGSLSQAVLRLELQLPKP